jgi:beta-glucosidase-like glycosyl hydrolase
MTVEQRISQLMVVSIDDADLTEDDLEVLRRRPPGGVVLYRRHLKSEAQTRALTRRIIAAGGHLRPWIAVDHEHGAVKRLPVTGQSLPGNMALGATRSAALAREAGLATGAALRHLGIDVNFGPVLDVAIHPRSPIGTRSFSDDPQLVATLGVAFIDGQSSATVASVAKHFVGEGAVAGDTHDGSAVLVDDEHGGIAEASLIPFRAAIQAGVPAVMTSHIAAPHLTHRGNLPITYSRAVTTDLLRGRLGFEGVILSDELGMRGARQYSDAGELALWALEAGVDMVIVAGRVTERSSVFQRLIEAHRSGRLSDVRIDESVRRILAMKQRWCSPGRSTAQPEPALSTRIAAQSLTSWGAALPSGVRGSAGAVVFEADGFLGGRLGIPSVTWVEPDPCVPQSPLAGGAPRLVLASIATRQHAEQARRWIERYAPTAIVIAIALGDPRDLAVLGSYDTAVAAYSGCPASRDAVVAFLTMGGHARGSPPVTLTHPAISPRPPALPSHGVMETK